jgi:hypothetical protein
MAVVGDTVVAAGTPCVVAAGMVEVMAAVPPFAVAAGIMAAARRCAAPECTSAVGIMAARASAAALRAQGPTRHARSGCRITPAVLRISAAPLFAGPRSMAARRDPSTGPRLRAATIAASRDAR